MNKITLVLGMHRTGTSLLTSVLHDLGFNPGNELLEGDKYNLDGYWEYKPLLDLHEKMLADYGNQWFAPGHDMPLHELLFYYRDEAEALVRSMDAEDRDWCWKEPRLVIFLDFWLEILAGRDIKWIITHRNPAAIAHSLKSRNHFDIETGLRLWEYTMSNLMSGRDSLKDTITIQYEEMLSDPKQQIDRMAAYLQPDWNVEKRQSVCDTAALRIRSEAIHERDFSDVVLTSHQILLEKMIREGLHPHGMTESETIMSAHRRYFRKMLRDISIEKDKRLKELEAELAVVKYGMYELQQVIQAQKQQFEELDTVRGFMGRRISTFKSSIHRLIKKDSTQIVK